MVIFITLLNTNNSILNILLQTFEIKRQYLTVHLHIDITHAEVTKVDHLIIE